MLKPSPLSIAVRRALSGVAIASAAAIPAVLQAQEPAKDVAEVVVTGSRIAADPNLVTSNPVTQVTAEELVQRGVTRVEDFINDLPQITPELTSNESNGATGTATLDLRGLGSDRTLVLTNGHRMGFGDPFVLSPDVNQIPGALIERIEILTGGASSTYGSDAIAGVVNFVMKRNFEGFQFDYQYSGYQHEQGNGAVQQAIDNAGFVQAPNSATDGGTRALNMILGVNTEDGNGNVTAYFGYRDINAILQSERDFSACSLSANNGRTCSGSATIATGLFTPFDGTAYYTVQGNQFVDWDGSYYNFGPLNYFQRPDQRYTGGLFAHYQVHEKFEPYAEFMFMDDRSLAQIAPSGAFFVTDSINCDNPFLSTQQFGALGCTAGASVPFYIGRRMVEGGPRFDDLRHTSFRLMSGLRGDLTSAWSYDVSANFSRMIYSETYNNDLSTTRIVRALDVVPDPVTGAPVCQSVVDGSDPTCVPWNLFTQGGTTQDAIDYLVLPLFSKGELEQDQIVAYITGDLTDKGVKLPSAADGLKLVVGAEYRDESVNYEPDQGFTSGDGAGQGGPTSPVFGQIDVTDFFAEVQLPLVQDKPGIQSMTLDLRYRNSDYSTGVTSDAYNAQAEYTPVEGLKFRGGVSKAVRAANIRELFEPSNFGLWSGVDPCAGNLNDTNPNNNPTMPLAQCVNTGVTAAQYGSIPLSPAGQYGGVFSGNQQLEPEKSDSFTVGAVFDLDQWVNGLHFSVDYWSIEIEQAIDDNDPEFIIRQCGTSNDPAFCSLITRGPNGNLWIGTANVDLTRVNLGFFDTAGIDVTGNYRVGFGEHNLGFAYRGTWLEKWDQQVSPGADVDDCAGVWGGSCGRPRPDYKHTFQTTWSTPWNLTTVVAWRHVGAVDEFFAVGQAVSVNAFNAGSEDYFDLSASYTADFGIGETTFSLGVSNVTDNDPPVNGRFGGVSVYGNGNTIPGTWDALGRYYFIGVTQGF